MLLISIVYPKRMNDRFLYYDLIDRVNREREKNGFITLGTYEGILYWKLYSQPAAVKNVCFRIRECTAHQVAIQETLIELGKQLPQTLSDQIEEVKRIYQMVQRHREGSLRSFKFLCATRKIYIPSLPVSQHCPHL